MSEEILQVDYILGAAAFRLNIIENICLDFSRMSVSFHSPYNLNSDFPILLNIFALKCSAKGSIA